MDKELLDFLTEVSRATCEKEVWNVWLKACQNSGFDVVNYTYVQKNHDDSVKTRNLTNLDLKWMEHYQKEKFCNDDYLVKYIIEKNITPIIHDIEHINPNLIKSGRQKEIFNDVIEFGMSKILAIPLNDISIGCGGVTIATSSMSSNEFKQVIKQKGTLLFAMAQVAHQRLKYSYMTPLPKDTIHFSPRQQEIIKYLANGLPNKEISYRLNISMPTVSFHLKAIANKLNVRMSREILPKALLLGLVQI